MPKTKISEYSATANSNTDVASINIDEGCAPSGINNAIRAVMGHLKDFQSGTSNDPFTVGSSGSLTLSYGTANGVAYLNGSKVLTTGSALTYDGTNLTVNTGTVSATYGKLTVAGGISITPDSSSKFQIGRYSAGAPYSYIKMGSTSSGLKFTDPADSVDLAVLDSAGNLGLGVTPSASYAGYKTFQIASQGVISSDSTSNGALEISTNSYRAPTTANFTYINSFAATLYSQYRGEHRWYNAASGTAGNAITFTQAMTLDSGNLLVGKTALNLAVGTSIDANTSTGSGVRVVSSATTASADGFQMYSTGTSTYRFAVGFNGTISAVSTVISSISDARLKENVRDLNVGLSEIMALKPRLYDWKEGKGADIKNARGFIAQEFEIVFPDLIDESRDPAPEGEGPYKAVRADLIPVLVKAIQEQQAIIQSLTARITALESA